MGVVHEPDFETAELAEKYSKLKREEGLAVLEDQAGSLFLGNLTSVADLPTDQFHAIRNASREDGRAILEKIVEVYTDRTATS